MIRKPRGTMDIMPEETPEWRYVEENARRAAAEFGFGEIRTPGFEATELFHRGVGETTDVVQKEMYTFEDREGRSFTLRPEGTASVVRALIENGRCSDAMPMKLWYLINCFRYEKPQAGRSREFFQFGAEMFGAADPSADAEIIALAHTLIGRLGIKGVSLHINSIGCPECRPAYRAALKEYFAAHADGLCDTCRARLETNPMRILDCKSPECKAIAAGAPKTVDYLCDDCRVHFETLGEMLAAQGIEYTIDTNIVRGLDYYTRTVFEFIAEGIGAQSTVCGGGRYDGLMHELGGPEMPGIGFAMGLTRLLLAMRESGVQLPDAEPPALYIATMGTDAKIRGAALAAELRRCGVRVDRDLVGRSLKAQMKYADKIGARRTLIIGESEIETGKANLRSMADSSQTEVDINDPAALAKVLENE